MLCNRGGMSSSVELETKYSLTGFFGCHKHRVIGRFVAHNRPGYSRRSVRQRNRRNIHMLSCCQLVQPSTQPIISILRMSEHGPGAVHQQLPQVAITAFTDAQQSIFPTSTMLAWRKAQGCGEIMPSPESLAITQGTGKRACGKWPDTA